MSGADKDSRFSSPSADDDNGAPPATSAIAAAASPMDDGNHFPRPGDDSALDDQRDEGEERRKTRKKHKKKKRKKERLSTSATATTAAATLLDGGAGICNAPRDDGDDVGPLPMDAQILAALQEEGDVDEAEKKKPGVRPEEIHDDGPPLPAGVAAAAGATATAKKNARERLEVNEESNDRAAVDGYFTERDDGSNPKEKATAAADAPRAPRTADAGASPTSIDPVAGAESTIPPPVTHAERTLSTRGSVGQRRDQAHASAPVRLSSDRPPSVPTFHAMEARLVEVEPAAPVYEATVVVQDASQVVPSDTDLESDDDDQSSPWWIRNHKLLIFGTVLVLCVTLAVVSTLLASQGGGGGDGGTENDKFLGSDGGGQPTNKPTSTTADPTSGPSPSPSVDAIELLPMASEPTSSGPSLRPSRSATEDASSSDPLTLRPSLPPTPVYATPVPTEPPTPKACKLGNGAPSNGGCPTSPLPGQFCLLPYRECKYKSLYWWGVCTDVPVGCTADVKLVCGCDDVTYTNECQAYRQGASVAHGGACMTSNPTGGPTETPTPTPEYTSAYGPR